MMKRIFIIGAVILFILSANAYGFGAAGNQPQIELDGITMQAAALIDGGKVYLPLQAVGEALGYKINGPEEDGTIYISRPGKNIVVDLKNQKITANDHVYHMSGDYTGIVDRGSTAVESTTWMRADFFSDHLGLKVLWDRQGGRVKLESVKENAISIRTVKEATETDKIKITLQFPQIEGLEDKTVQDGINSVFSKSAEAARAEGLKNADYIAEDTGSPNKYETYFDYRLKYNQNGLLSVIFMNYQYAGGAHGLTVQSSRTFHLKTGEEYRLRDLIKDDADYIPLISSIVGNQIRERVKEGLLSELSIAPFQAIKEEQDFYLSNNAVMVYFQQYEYFPYAAGIQEFAVDFSAMKDRLKTDFSFLNDEPKLLEAGGALNSLNVGETGRVVVRGNPTTGFAWHYTVEKDDIVKLDSENEVRDSGQMGAGNTYTWNFKALKAGQTRIIFKYYRDGEGEAAATADNTIEYLLCVNLPAADGGDAGITAAPVQYSLSVDGGSVSLWAYVIDGGVYFKLRDLAMALSGTEKQFSVSWAAEDNYSQVDLSSGMAYTPAGGELKAPLRTGNTAAQPTAATFYIDTRRAAILAYTVDGAHYVRLSDLAATLKFAAACDGEKRTAEIDTSPPMAPVGITGEAFDNIALAHAGNAYSLDKDGNVILSYGNGKNMVKAPLVLDTSDLYSPGREVQDTGFYISGAKTAIAFGGGDAPIQVLISDDMGKTWDTYPVESSKYMSAHKYISFITKDDGFLVASSGSSLGTSYNYVFTTSDGGKTWTQIGNPNALYPRNTTGAGFSTRDIGFISFRVDLDPGPTIYRTTDGGYTWEKLAVTVPDKYDYNIPLSPVFSGANGMYPVQFYPRNGEKSITYYLTSNDYGRTWTYDEKYNY